MISPDTDGFRAKADAGIKRALSGLRYAVPIGLEVTDIPAALARLRTLLRTGNVADFLDVNIPTGRLITQIQMIRRLLRQGGVSDLLEVNLDKASLTKAMAAIKSVSATIPVNFDLSNMPVVGPVGSLTEHIQAKWDIPRLKPLADTAARGVAEHIPVMFDVGALPVTGAVSSLTEHIAAKWDIPPLKPLADTAARGVSEHIPVTFDVGRLPVVGPVGSLTEHIQAKWDIPPLKPLADTAARGVSEHIPVTFDVGRLPVMGATQSLTEKATIDTSAAQAALTGLDTKLIQTSLDAIAMARSLAGGNSALAIMSGSAAQVAASVAAGRAAIAGLASSGQGAQTAMTDLSARLAILDGSAMNFAAATVAMTGTGSGGGGLRGLAVALAGASAAFNRGGGNIFAWGGKLTGTIPILGKVISSVSAWHLVLDLAIEGLISIGLAATAAAVGIAAMAPAAQDIYLQLKSIQNVNSALGSQIPPLTGRFGDLAKAMAPQVIEAYGGALNLVSGKTGKLADVAAKVVTLFDDWIAKINLFAQGKNFGQFLQAGIGYLSQFGSILGKVGQALATLLTKDPGIARFLLDFIGGVAKLLLMFSQLPGPVVYAALALHGFYIWGSLLVPLVLRLTGYLLGLGAAFLTLIANPFFWVAAAVVALAALAYQSTQASSAAKEFNAAIDQLIASDTASKAILDIATSIGQLTAQINASTGPVNAMRQWNAQSESLSGGFQRLSYNLRATGSAFGKAFGDVPQMLSTWPALGRTVTDFGHAIADIFSSSSGASIKASNDIKSYEDHIQNLINEQGTLFLVAGKLVSGNNDLTKSSYSLAQALALEDLAGVKAGDSLQLASQKVKNLLAGYQAMSVQGPILSNSVNAITLASLQQQSGISNLTSAWTGFITLVTGGLNSFATFQQQISTISSALTGIAPAASTGATSLGGLSAASLKADSAFVQGVTNANQLINALTAQASASGLASQGTDMLTAATKDTVAQLIPMAGHSVAAQSALIALAQQGGFPAGQSFQQLGKWVGTASGTMASAGASGGPAAQLNSITGTLAKTSSNLTTDVQNLSTALGTDLTQAESQAIILARGGVKPFQDFASAIANTGVNSDTTKQAAIKLGDEFLALAHNNVPAAKKEFESFAIGGLGLTKQQADQLWNDVTAHGIPALNAAGGKAVTAEGQFVNFAIGGLGVTKANAKQLWQMFSQQNLDVMSTKAGGAKTQFIQLALNGLKLTQTQAQSLWNMFVQQKLDMAATKAGETRRQFETLAGQLGLTRGAADKLWTSLHKVAAGSPYNSTVNVHGQGSGGINIVPTPSGLPTGNARFVTLAGGGVIRDGTTPTADDVLIRVSRGETVVSAEDSKKLAPQFAAVGVPGYAYGGITGNKLPQIPGFLGGVAAADAGGIEASFAKAMVAKIQAAYNAKAVAANAAALKSTGMIGSGALGQIAGGSNEAILQQVAAAHGWNSANGEWQALYNVEMREAGFSTIATNQSSGAYGMAQFINGPSEYAQYGGNSTTALGQSIGMCNYIAQRYGDPIRAWAHEQAYGWYKLGGVPLPAMAAGGTVSPAAAAVAAMRAKIVRQQSYEQADYRGLGDAFTHGPAKYRTKTVMRELGTIVREQAAEQAAYRKLAGTGLNASNLAHLRGAALAERATAGDKALNALPGGHPGWAGDMRNWLGKLAVPGSITPAMAAAIKAAAAAAAAGVPATHTYGGDVGPVVNDIGAFLQSSSVGALGAARGMKVPSFDRGGTLTPGMNLAWNGLGRNESLVPAGSSSTCITLEVAPGGGTAFDQFMTSWLRKHVHIKGAGSITRAFNEH